jgi:4-amino-4-deoxy-L-arabinose transferase-like glycosyltransferase
VRNLDRYRGFALWTRLSAHGWKVILVLALVTRLGHLALTWRVPLAADSLEYDDLGWKIARGLPYTNGFHDPLVNASVGKPTAIRTPGLPGYAALHYLLVGHRPIAVRFTLVLLNSLGAVALYASSRRRYGSRVAWIAGLTWALWPEAIHSFYASDSFLAETLAVPLFLYSVWLFDRSDKVGWAALAGLAFGVAILARGYLLPALPLVLIHALLWARPRWPMMRRLLVLTGVAGACLFSWGFRNYLVFGHLILQSSQQGLVLWVGNFDGARGSGNGQWKQTPAMRTLLTAHPELPAASEVQKSRIYRTDAIATVRRAGIRRFATLEARKLALFFYPFEIEYGFQPWFAIILLVFPVGIWRMVGSTDGTSVLLLSSIAAVLMASLITYHEARFRICAVPGMIAISAIGVDWILSRFGPRSFRHMKDNGSCPP